MPKVLEASEVDLEQESVDEALTVAEEAQLGELLRKASPEDTVSDLSDGGRIGGANLYPTHNGIRQTVGRPTVRRAWMWNGTETMLPLTWNTDGTQHDNARRYLTKRHCLCCNTGGFRTRAGQLPQCPNCVKNNCNVCGSSSDPKKIIPSFYLIQEQVPYPTKFFGDIPCFLDECPRRGAKGFLTGQAMRLHATSRHKKQYQAYLEATQADRRDEISRLTARIDKLQGKEPKRRRRKTKTVV